MEKRCVITSADSRVANFINEAVMNIVTATLKNIMGLWMTNLVRRE